MSCTKDQYKIKARFDELLWSYSQSKTGPL